MQRGVMRIASSLWQSLEEFVSVVHLPTQPHNLQCSATTLKMNPKLKNRMTIGSTFNPGLSSVYNLSMVPVEPPAPAARVEEGLAFLTDSL